VSLHVCRTNQILSGDVLIHRKVYDTLHRYLVLLVLFIGGEPLCAPAENQTQVSGIPHRRNGHYTTGAKLALGEASPNF
jgi:hypothetical protein